MGGKGIREVNLQLYEFGGSSRHASRVFHLRYESLNGAQENVKAGYRHLVRISKR